MIVDEVRLPVDVEQGVQGGPMFNTDINVAKGGQVNANQNWSYPLYQGNVSYGIQDKTDLDDVIAFFWARRGRARGFLFKDWSDYEMTNQTLGTGDGVNRDFALIKTYPDTVTPFLRPITRPIESTIVVYKNGVAASASHWSLITGGTIRFTVPQTPGVGVVVTATCEFNIACRFLTDQLTMSMTLFNVGAIPSLPIMEVRE